MDDIEESVALFLKSIELRPDYGVAHLSLGVARVRLGQLEAAAAAYTRALELEPNNAQARLFLRDVNAKLGRTNKALPPREHSGERNRDAAD